jgi:membrane associated rhomboid family serine protease
MTTPAAGPERPKLRDELQPYLVVVAMAAVMWVVEIIDLLPGTDLDRWGIQPRALRGLTGIVAAPFLHDGLGHLIGNTVPFLVLGCIIASSGTRRFVQVTVIVGVFAGLGTWIFGPANTVHIGASGLVFGYLTYLVTRGFFERHIGQILVGLVVLFFYGSILWGLLPRPGISFTGHLFGAVGGVVAAWFIHRRPDAPENASPAPPSSP